MFNFIKRKSTGNILSADSINKIKEAEKRMNEAKRQKEIEDYKNDVEYKANTSVFFFYLASVYSIYTFNKFNELLSDTEKKSLDCQKIAHDLEKTNSIMQDGFTKFASLIETKEDFNKVDKILTTISSEMAYFVEQQYKTLFFAIKDYYTKGKQNKKAENRAMASAYIICMRELIVTAKHATEVALNDYAEQLPRMNEILQLNALTSALSFATSAYCRITSPIKGVDLSKFPEVEKARIDVMREVADRQFFKAICILAKVQCE